MHGFSNMDLLTKADLFTATAEIDTATDMVPGPLQSKTKGST